MCRSRFREGEFFALLGPSGCGKTTLLRMLAGLEPPSEGRILIDDVDMASVPPNKRPVNMVFQSYAVFPHMSVRDNVAYGLKVDRIPAREREARVMEALELVKLEDLVDRKPDQLSGGQRQRVALARALVKRPRVLLLDEPLSALDAKLREAMRFELTRIQDKVGVTFVMVTHDQNEALAMACRCALMHKGVLQQVATPSDLYEYPNNRFVADFIGSINLFEGRLEVDEPGHAVIASRGARRSDLSRPWRHRGKRGDRMGRHSPGKDRHGPTRRRARPPSRVGRRQNTMSLPAKSGTAPTSARKRSMRSRLRTAPWSRLCARTLVATRSAGSTTVTRSGSAGMRVRR